LDTDRIEKEVVLHAPLARVWHAISDSSQFGYWFGVEFDGPFVQGQQANGRIRPTQVDPQVAKLQQPMTGHPFIFWVEAIEPMSRIAFRWHPYAIDRNVDYSREPTTLISFELQAIGDTTRLRITESGFDRIPLSRRAEAFKANQSGWSHQVRLVEVFLAGHAPR
jgi:uncharacterized protein YndB with AHSA1/START domain